jgi:sugar lactone lactonase YvrE
LRLAGAAVKGYTEATGGDLTTARFNEFAGMAFDGSDTLYVCDESGSNVRALHLSAGTSELVAGSATGVRGFSGDGGPADQAKLDDAHGIAIGANGELFVCDKGNQRIRVIHADKTIDTVAGGGATYGDGPGTGALLGEPQGMAAGPNGTIFFTMRTVGAGFENVVRLNADGSIALLTDKSLITSPGAIAVDAAKNLVYFTNNDVVKLLRDADGTPGAPEDVFTLPASGNPSEVRGLALDPAGTLYMMASDYSAVNSDYGTVNAHLYALPLGSDGLASGAAVAIAGTGGSSATEADYDVPVLGVMDPLTQLLSGGGSGMLTMGPTGTLFIGHTYKAPPKQWTEILQLKL